MAITTLATAITGLRQTRVISKALTVGAGGGRLLSTWGMSGSPAAGGWDNTLNGVTLSASVTGQIPWTDPVSANTYLGRLQGTASDEGMFWLCDRLWHNGGYTSTSTSAQNSTTPTWPARDANGATSGDGVFLAVEISATMGAAQPTITMSYTNSAGTSGRTGVTILAAPSSANQHSWFPIELQAGDTGVQSLQSLTLGSSWISGTLNVVAYRLIASLEIKEAGYTNVIDAISAAMPRMYDGSVPFILCSSATSVTAINFNGSATFTQG